MLISGAKPIAARHMAVLEELARRLPEDFYHAFLFVRFKEYHAAPPKLRLNRGREPERLTTTRSKFELLRAPEEGLGRSLFG